MPRLEQGIQTGFGFEREERPNFTYRSPAPTESQRVLADGYIYSVLIPLSQKDNTTIAGFNVSHRPVTIEEWQQLKALTEACDAHNIPIVINYTVTHDLVDESGRTILGEELRVSIAKPHISNS